jgi:hypothetical protein
MTNFTCFASLRRAFALVAALSLFAFGVSNAATITIVNNNAAGVGFNDPTPRAPIGGNPGTTVGDQRLYLFQYAANIWGGILPSTVPILVRSQFASQTCNATSGVLGSAGPVTIHANFPGAEFAGTWYHAALANKLNGADLDATNPDINATFNSNLDLATCLGGIGWYYGTDGLEGTAVELLPVLLHEMGHGLGFSTTTSGTSGNYNSGLPGLFDRFMLDVASGLHWNQNTAAQRVASAISGTGLVWDGPAGDAAAAAFLAHRPRMLVNAPGGIAGSYGCNHAAFGPQVYSVTGNVVLVQDAVAPTGDGCDAIVNAAAISGNIALIDRGTCTFVVKAGAAQAAGAIAVIIANNAAGAIAPGGADPTITIPVIGITQADGNTLKANLGLGVNVTLDLDPVLLAGADPAGRPFMYTPNPFQSGSSVSHFDVSETPNALMEPAINNDLHDSVDMTDDVFNDLGWFGRPTPTLLANFTAVGNGDGILVRWQFSDLADVGAITLQRSRTLDGPWSPISTELGRDGDMTTALDRNVEPATLYYYRLNVMDRSGAFSNYGLTSAQLEGVADGGLFFARPVPNPTTQGTAFSFRLSQPEFVRLTVVDATGRVVRELQNAMMPAGSHSRMWDGNDAGSQRVAPGVYFANLRTSQGVKIQRVAVIH